MSKSPRCPDGWYTASASAVRTMQTSDGMPFVQATIALLHDDTSHVTDTYNRQLNVLWRGSLTRGATARTYDALCAMGSRVRVERDTEWIAERMLDGVGEPESPLFRVQIRSVPCDDAEAPGAWKMFVVGVKAMECETPMCPTAGCLLRSEHAGDCHSIETETVTA